MKKVLINSNDNVSGFCIIQENESTYNYYEWDELDENYNELTGEDQPLFVIRQHEGISDFELINLSYEYERASKLELIEHIGFNACLIRETFESFEELKDYCKATLGFEIK